MELILKTKESLDKVLSYESRKHFFIIFRGVFPNCTIQWHIVPFEVFILYLFQVHFNPSCNDSSKSPFICSLIVDPKSKNLLKILVGACQTIDRSSHCAQEIVLRLVFQILGNSSTKFIVVVVQCCIKLHFAPCSQNSDEIVMTLLLLLNMLTEYLSL
ncbi:hypothetical protein GIB67_014803 [Kingdonia uniflora]|uniref:Uncharacterized protein n=1 Tax=Kingdonia uniflora TaxID=39325 RepID=A0A7J7NUY7_9MAGN|nr:hypothetical protein GIB67_014803 [Kingdonia uniflora]